MKVCKNCKIEKDEKLGFYRNKTQKDGYNTWCKICARNYTDKYKIINKEERNAYLIQYRKNNPKKIKEANLKRYNLSLQDFEDMLGIQENKCSICNNTFTNKNIPCVDHCHISKQVRSLLCKWCNRALGLFKDDPTICKMAAQYLEIHKNLLTTKEKYETIENEERKT